MSTINLRLKQLRRQKNLSQEELAGRLGVSRQAIIALEQGASLPSLPVIMALLRELDVPFHTLLDSSWNPFRSYQTAADDPSNCTVALVEPPHFNTEIPVSLVESPTAITVCAELAGVRDEDLTIDLSSQHVAIMATKRPRLEQNDDTVVHQQEMRYGQLIRILSLPAPIDTTTVHAEFSRGILTLHLPKFMPSTKRRITFKNTETSRPEGLEVKESHGSK